RLSLFICFSISMNCELKYKQSDMNLCGTTNTSMFEQEIRNVLYGKYRYLAPREIGNSTFEMVNLYSDCGGKDELCELFLRTYGGFPVIRWSRGAEITCCPGFPLYAIVFISVLGVVLLAVSGVGCFKLLTRKDKRKSSITENSMFSHSSNTVRVL
ncbi:hypothetical protein PMAYCL1PPCAC_33131, partial [Pristionchus mayeri]